MTTKNERFGSDIQHVELMMNRGIDLRNRRFVVGIPFMEHNPENDVSFPLAANILTAMDVLEFQYESIEKNLNPARDHRDHIEIVMCTYGGDCYYMFGVYDRIKSCKVPVHSHVYGPCMSAGTIILMAADKRFMSPNADLMLHYGSSYDEGTSHPARLEEYMRQEKDVIDRMARIYLSRCNHEELAKDGREHMMKKLSRLAPSASVNVENLVKEMSTEQLAKEMLHEIILSKDTYLNAEQCLRYGLIDGIIPFPERDKPILSEA